MRRIACFASLLLLVPLAALALLLVLRGGAGPALVDDGAGLLAPSERAFLAEYHAYLLADHDIDYRVVTRRGVGDIALDAVGRYEALGVGEESATGRGLLLVVDPEQDLVRLEVAHALEGVYPDAFVAYVEQRQMVPFFQSGRPADGILAASELIIERAQRAAANAGFEGEAWFAGSGGAGATAPARLGAGGPVAGVRRIPGAAAAGRTPEATLRAYLAAMRERNGSPELDIYTDETRAMLRRWVVTPAQMDGVVRIYRGCHAEPARFGPGGRLAVIRYPASERACAPWFFRRVDGGWALDLTMMQRAIRFGRGNAWRLDPGASHPYGFAFADWRFDRDGFPVVAAR